METGKTRHQEKENNEKRRKIKGRDGLNKINFHTWEDVDC